MDIKDENFWEMLPIILPAIAHAAYVAFDLEMTGIKSRNSMGIQRTTLDQTYADAKDVAESFQIVQFGLTCVSLDEAGGCYITQSFNFHVTPMFVGKQGAGSALARTVDRRVCLSYSTLLFLQQHGFRLENAFAHGVPYLSRQEEREAQQQLLERDRRNDLVDVEKEDEHVRQFYSTVRNQTQAWLAEPEYDFLNIENPHGGIMNRLQIRLVHQLIEEEFKELRAISKGHFMQIAKKGADQEEEKFWQSRHSQRIQAIRQQTGLRLVVEALTGGSFAEALNEEMMQSPAAKEDETSRKDSAAQVSKWFLECEAQLKEHRPILVGHNMLLDLCFLYRTFIGPLPETVDGFQREIHRLFPRMVDTKYVATYDSHSMISVFDLQGWYATLSHLPEPRMKVVHPDFGYEQRALHTAGYDSNPGWMTAVVFTKLSWARMSGVDLTALMNGTQSDPRSQKKPASPAASPRAIVFPLKKEYLESPRRNKSISPTKRGTPATPASQRVSESGSVMTLLDDGDDSSAAVDHIKPLAPEVLSPSKALEVPRQNQTDSSSTPLRQSMALDWDSDFFREHGNKICAGAAGTLRFPAADEADTKE